MDKMDKKYVIFPTEEEAEAYRVRLQAHHDAGMNQDTTKPKIIDCIIKTWRGYALSLQFGTWPDVVSGIIVDSIEDPKIPLLVDFVEHLEATVASGTIDPVSRSSFIGAYIKHCNLTGNEPIDHYITSPSTGKLYKIHLGNPEGVLAQLIHPLTMQRDSQWIYPLVAKLNDCLQDPAIQSTLKFNILNVENALLRHFVISNLNAAAPDQGRKFCTIRRELVLAAIDNPLKYFPSQDVAANQQTLLSLHRLYIDTERDIYLRLNCRDFLLKFFDDLFVVNRQKKELLVDLFKSAIIANHRAMLLTSEAIRERLDLYRETLGREQFEQLDREIEYGGEQNSRDIRGVTVQLANTTFRGIQPTELFTEIQFVLPFEMQNEGMEDNRRGSLNGLPFNVIFRKIKSSYEDPTIVYLRNIGSDMINGLPNDLLSDVNPDLGSTLLVLQLDGCAALDFDVTDDGVIKEKPLEDEKALRGGWYYPHKELALNLLRALYRSASIDFPLKCELEHLDIDVFSNFIINYCLKEGQLIVHRKAYLLTSKAAFHRAYTRYGDQISELYRRDKHVSIKALIDNSVIQSNESFRDFVYKVVELTVKEYVEGHSCWEYLWEGGPTQPKSEPHAHPLINSYLRTVLEMKGIRVSREVRMANGAVDFFCSYTTKRNDVLKVCIEAKNAHGEGLERGISKQLPAYMDKEQTHHGIYLVLWYKGADWPQPEKFGSINEISARLEAIRPNENYRIDVMCVNCTKPIQPSKM